MDKETIVSPEKKDLELVKKIIQARKTILEELHKIIVGQDVVIEQLLISLFARGHSIVVGVPGLAKTLLVSSLAQILDLEFKRIQFTPDLMPSDVTGTEVIEENVSTGERIFRFIKGPIFANIVLADEINRTPPKTQAALLQAMQEYKVTVAGQTYPLPLPFFVLATQNPIEQEGTYPLPEAQLDRFFFQVNITYPEEKEEEKILEQTTSLYQPNLKKVLNANDVLSLQEIVRKVPVSDYVNEYTVKLIRATRSGDSVAPEFIRKYVTWGASPRAAQHLLLAGKTRALLVGKYAVSVEDINFLLAPVLRHRLILNFNAEAEGITTEEIIRRLLDTVKP
jgi:MoxR-like ATPase